MTPTRLPLVFAQGLFTLSGLKISNQFLIDYFRGVENSLKILGYEVLITRVTSGNSIEERSHQLKTQIENELGSSGERMHVIAHSTGGLDARFMIARLGMDHRVVSLTSIGVPHRGSPVAELMIKSTTPFLTQPSSFNIWQDLTPSSCARFNDKVPDVSHVNYFSYGGDCSFWQVTPVLWPFFAFLLRAEGPNDGLVSVASARWGRYLGPLPADHLQQVGWDLTSSPKNRFNTLRFYQQLALFLTAEAQRRREEIR